MKEKALAKATTPNGRAARYHPGDQLHGFLKPREAELAELSQEHLDDLRVVFDLKLPQRVYTRASFQN